MRPTHHALMSRVYRFLEDLTLEQISADQYREARVLSNMLYPLVVEPPELVNPGKESGAGGIPWRGEHLGPRGDL